MLNKISVIVPCKNEERYISMCMDSLLAQINDGYDLDIIVVDNGSSDNTLDILNKYRELVEVCSMPYIPVAEVRNYGAKKSRGEWLAFVDADVEVDHHWCQNIEKSLNTLSSKGLDVKKVVTGSTCSIPEEPTWVEKVWFQQLVERDQQSSRYINGANLIVHRSLYNVIGGFDPQYITGEDEKFCEDAQAHGGIIIKDSSIKAIHHGYPKTIKQFFRRERWHGLGMAQYFSTPWKSRDLCLVLYLFVLLLIFPVLAAFCMGVIPGLIFTLMMMLAPLFVFSFFRSNKKFESTILLTWLYFVYGWARLLSILDIIRLFPKTGDRAEESVK